MRVLLVLGRSAGGIARHVAMVHEGLSDRNGLEIFNAAPAGLPIVLPQPSFEVEIPDGPVAGHRKAVGELRSLIRRLGIDVVHAHGLRAGIDGGLAAPGPSLVTVHNLVHPEVAGRLKAPLYRSAERIVTRVNDRVLCVSQQIATHLKVRVPKRAGRIETSYLAVDEPAAPTRTADELRMALGCKDRPLIVAVARLAKQKALGTMIEAVGRIDNCVLAILGEGPLESELRELAERAAPDRVRFLGFRPDVTDHLRAADVFCLSSVWEGIPLAAMEAIQVGTPVVATDVGGMSELVVDGVSGRLVPPSHPAALADALVSVLSDPALGGAYAREAQRAFADRFDRARMLAHLAAIYRGSDA